MPSPQERIYSAHGFGLSVSFETDRHVRTADQTVQYHGFRPASPEDVERAFSVRLGHDINLRLPNAAEHVLTHPSGVRLLRHADSIYLVRGEAVMRVNPDRGTAVARLDAEADGGSTFTIDSTLYLFLTFALVLLLQSRDLYVLHAAAVSHNDDDGILIVAPSGSGKSTLTMRLIESGWKYVSDDSILVHKTAGDVIAYPFRRDATVFTESLGDYRKAQPHGSPLFSDDAKSLIEMDSAYPGQRLEAITPKTLVFPSITGSPTTRIENTDPATAMVGLIAQASFLTADSPRVKRLMDVLNSIVQQTRHVNLHAGTDLRDDPDLADKLISDLVRS